MKTILQLTGVGAATFATIFGGMVWLHETPDEKLTRQFSEYTSNIQTMSKLYVENGKNYQKFLAYRLEQCVEHGDAALALYDDVQTIALPEQNAVVRKMRNACVREWNRRVRG